MEKVVTNLLDRPVWSSLGTRHAGLALGDDLARRYKPEVNRFASARDDSDEALAALASLVGLSDQVFILQVPDIRVSCALNVLKRANGVQMVARSAVAPPVNGPDGVIALGDADAVEMLALATLTEPGPFLRRTHRMGSFFGIRVGGQLAAMAGERFRFPGHTEVSGVCTHPDFRGHGYARHLSMHVAAAIAARGETAFLHAWKNNVAAITLYESLGFQLRCEVNVAVVERRSGAGGPE